MKKAILVTLLTLFFLLLCNGLTIAKHSVTADSSIVDKASPELYWLTAGDDDDDDGK